MSFDESKMVIMPAVDIKNGKCVQLVQGKPGTEQVIIENPEETDKEKIIYTIENHLYGE
jgi:phosphoribosylformimino-5-aminoimidazole carboxamide ribotide isomerase